MMKPSQPLTAEGVSDYFRREYTDTAQRYYSEGGETIGRWHGKLATELGLIGGVQREHFERIANGQHPFTGEQLIKHRQFKAHDHKAASHRAAWDLMVAPPKSVSATALVGGDTRIRKAHDESVKATADAIEEYIQVRLSGGRVLTTGNFVVAMFEHDTARPVEGGIPMPQLHTHLVLMNISKDPTGKMRSLDPREIFRVQSWATAIYRAELTDRLRRLGYEIERTKWHSFEIKGYTPEYLEAISPRKKQIDAEMEKRGLQGPKAAAMIALSTRDAKQEWGKAELLAEHQKQAVDFGSQPAQVVAAGRVRGFYAVPLDQRTETAHEGITYAKRRLAERNAVLDHYEVERDALHYGLGGVTHDDVKQSFAERLKGSEFVEVAHYRTFAPGHRYTTPEMLTMEREILAFERDGRGRSKPIAETLDRNDFRETHRAHLLHGQMWLVWNIAQSNDRVIGVQGNAGTGKTTALSAIRKIVEHHDYDTIGLAPTSGAAKQLKTAGMRTMTVQKFLSHPDTSENKPRFYFVDESSLAATVQMHQFLSRIRPMDRVALVGDTKQHQSVEAGRIFEEMQEGGMSTFTLKKIVRQQDPLLKEIVRQIANGNTESGVRLLDKVGGVEEITHARRLYRRIASDYAADPEGTMILSVDNESREELSLATRAALRHVGLLDRDLCRVSILTPRQDLTKEDTGQAFNYHEGDVIRYPKANSKLCVRSREYATVILPNATTNQLTVKHEDGRILTYDVRQSQGVSVFEPKTRSFAVGERIQFTAPVPEKHIANRDLGTILKLDAAGNAKIKIDDGPAISINLKRIPHLDYGYALTSYSAQGHTCDRLLLHAPAGNSRLTHMLDQAYAYVGMSRPRHELKVYTDSREDLIASFGRQHHKPKALSLEEIREYQATHEIAS